MGKVPHASTLGIHCRNEIIAEIDRRAEVLGLKRSTYAAQILEKWMTEGCPPVSAPDRLMQLAQFPNGKPRPPVSKQ